MAKKKVAKKAAKKAVSKKAAKKAPAKKVAKKAVKKAAKKAPAKKAPVKKVAKKAVKKAAKPAPAAKKAPVKVETPAPAKKAARKATKKVEEEIEPPVVIRKFVKPDVLAKLSAFEKKQKQKLIELRDKITDMMYGMQQETKSASEDGADGGGMHQGDAGSDAYDRDFALNLLSKEHDALEEIENALNRLDLGTYGICEISKDKIPKPRLEAIPFARLTVECQAKWEEQNGHRKFTQSDAFGFN